MPTRLQAQSSHLVKATMLLPVRIPVSKPRQIKKTQCIRNSKIKCTTMPLRLQQLPSKFQTLHQPRCKLLTILQYRPQQQSKQLKPKQIRLRWKHKPMLMLVSKPKRSLPSTKLKLTKLPLHLNLYRIQCRMLLALITIVLPNLLLLRIVSLFRMLVCLLVFSCNSKTHLIRGMFKLRK